MAVKKEQDSQTIRLDWIDSLKAIAILLVLIGHMTANGNIEAYIYSFHIPLFFFISGYVFQGEKYLQFKTFMIRRIRTLIIPYFMFAVFSFLVWLVLVRSFSIRGQVHSQNPWYPFLGIVYGVGIAPWRNPLDMALWFLPCLFMTEMIYWILRANVKGVWLLLCILICGCAGYCTSIWSPFRLPWSSDVALTSVVLYAAGNKLKEGLNRTLELCLGWKILLLFFALSVGVGISILNGKADMNYNLYGNPGLFYIGAICGIAFWVIVGQSLPLSKTLRYIGRNTITVLGLSGVTTFLLRGVYYVITGNLFGPNTFHFAETFLYSALILGCLVPMMYVLNHFLPFMLGRRS